MHQHRPRSFRGPVRGTETWWRGLQPQPESTPTEEKHKKVTKKTTDAENDPQIRKDLVDRVRKEIAAGTYDTQDKWEAALDSLLDRLAE